MTFAHFIPVAPAWPLLLLAVVAVERVIELVISRRHQRALMAEGGVEIGAGHYPFIVAVHAAWLLALTVWTVSFSPRVNPALVAAFLLLQPLRFWVIATLGRYWTTRIITVPNAPLIASGPYRYLRHPNYTVVVLEIALLPLALGAWPLAAVFSALNAMVLDVRLKAENRALAQRPRAAS